VNRKIFPYIIHFISTYWHADQYKLHRASRNKKEIFQLRIEEPIMSGFLPCRLKQNGEYICRGLEADPTPRVVSMRVIDGTGTAGGRHENQFVLPPMAVGGSHRVERMIYGNGFYK